MQSEPSLSHNGRIIQAGAGAGKTTRLIKEVFEFYEHVQKDPTKHQRIVLTTFSNKSTQEIKDRLLAEAIKKSDLNFFNFINDSNRILVSTIHGILSQVLRQSARDLGQMAGLEVIDDREEQILKRKIFKRILTLDMIPPILFEDYTLNELFSLSFAMERNWSEIQNSSIVTSADFVKNLESKKLEIFRKIVENLKLIKNFETSKSWTDFFEQIPNSWLEAKIPNWDELSRWRDSQDRNPVVSRKGETALRQAQIELIEALKEIDTIQKSGWLEPNLIEKMDLINGALIALGERFTDEVNTQKRELGLLSMFDLEELCFHYAERDPGFLSRFGDQWSIWLIDEFQDTNLRQLKMLSRMIQNSHVLFVGDPQQSIYFFRGADSDVFAHVFKFYERNGSTEFLLDNYRSEVGVLNFINSFFELQFTQFARMNPKKEKTTQEPDVLVYECADEYFLQIGQHIQAMVNSDPNLSLEQIVVLSRRNADLKKMALILKKMNIPYRLHSQGQFFRRREVLDVLFFTAFLRNPKDRMNLVFLLKNPVFGLNHDDVLSVLNSESGINETVSKILSRFKDYQDVSESIGFGSVVTQFCIEFDLFSQARRNDPSGLNESNIWKALEWIKEKISLGELDQALESVLHPSENELFEDKESSAIIEPKMVQLMTIHGAKGLQFDTVILVGSESSFRSVNSNIVDLDTENKKFGIYFKTLSFGGRIKTHLSQKLQAMRRDREFQEYERLLYVALTRAKKQIRIYTRDKVSETSWAHQFKSFFLKQSPSSSNEFQFQWNSISEADLESESESVSEIESELKNADLLELKQTESRVDGSKVFLRDSSWVQIRSGQKTVSFTGAKEKSPISLDVALSTQRGIQIHKEKELNPSASSYYPVFGQVKDWIYVLSKGTPEFGFTFKYDGQLFTGSIDFVYFGDDFDLIIDYKSGSSYGNPNYRKQLQFYSQCLGFFKKWPKGKVIYLLLDYVDLQRTEIIEYSIEDTDSFFTQLKSNIGG